MVKVKRSDAHGNCGGKEMCRKFQWGNFRVKDHSLDKDVDVWITLKWIVRNEKKQGMDLNQQDAQNSCD